MSRISPLNSLVLACLYAVSPPISALEPVPDSPVVQAGATLSPAGEGRRLFLKLNCYSCHGARAGGGMGPNIARAEKADLKEAALHGQEGGMPGYKNYLSATDVNNLAAYLKSIGKPGEPVFNDWWVAQPTK